MTDEIGGMGGRVLHNDCLIIFMLVCLNLCESVWACVGVAAGGRVCILVRAYAYDVEG